MRMRWVGGKKRDDPDIQERWNEEEEERWTTDRYIWEEGK
jgi:hypothetical protein